MLLRPVAGLCTPYWVAQDQVFLFPASRTNDTQMKTRGSIRGNGNSNVVTNMTDEDGLSTMRQELFNRARDTTKLVFEPSQSFGNELLSLAETYHAGHEDWHLSSLARDIRMVIDDTRFMPLPEYSGLRMLADREDRMETDEDAEWMMRDTQSLWPEVKNVNVAPVRALKQGLLTYGLFLTCRYIRGFLAVGSRTSLKRAILSVERWKLHGKHWRSQKRQWGQ